MTDDSSPTPRSRLEIDWTRTAAGALAAVSSAVVLSRIGAAGTIIGAALGSVVATVASALYGQGLERSRERIAQAHAQAMQRVGAAQAEVRRASRRRAGADADPAAHSDLQHAQEHLVEAQRDLDAVAGDASSAVASPTWRDRVAALPWRHIALIAAALFVLTVVLITAFELLAGRSVASYTGGTHGSGGTSISQLDGSAGGSSPTPEPTPSTTPSDGPGSTTEPTPTAPTPSEAATPSASPSAPAPTPTTSPTSTPSEAPSGPASAVPTP